MVFIKTAAGQLVLKDRHGGLTSRQRSAFILFDGRRSLKDVLAATAAMGITQGDIDAMVQQGLLEPAGAAAAVAAGAAAMVASVTASGFGESDGLAYVLPAAEPAQDSGRSPPQRYQDAYPIATELTASLGLRGFRLNLAVEGSGSFDDLAALAPKIREAVGDAKYHRLDRALFG